MHFEEVSPCRFCSDHKTSFPNCMEGCIWLSVFQENAAKDSIRHAVNISNNPLSNHYHPLQSIDDSDAMVNISHIVAKDIEEINSDIEDNGLTLVDRQTTMYDIKKAARKFNS